jgi:hypothetical protein
MCPTAEEELLPGNLRSPTSVFIFGNDRPLLKWVALALFAPFSSRVYWTDIRLEGETLEPLDPFALHAVPRDRLVVVHPRGLQPEDSDARRVEAAAAAMFREDEPPDSIRRIAEFLRLPTHTQERISSTIYGMEPSVIVAANAHRLAALYSPDSIGPMISTILGAGTCLVILWADAATSLREVFDVVLKVEGSGPSDWPQATLSCEKGIASGKPVRLFDLPPIARVLKERLPPVPAQ